MKSLLLVFCLTVYATCGLLLWLNPKPGYGWAFVVPLTMIGLTLWALR